MKRSSLTLFSFVLSFILWLAASTASAFAQSSPSDQNHLPPSFSYHDAQAVFADFQTADYDITYDVTHQKASAQATIVFDTIEAGYPIFDSVETPSALTLDGQSVSQELIATPSQETQVRVLSTEIAPGRHALTVTLPITRSVTFDDQGVESEFWTTDLTDRGYLERYLPANFIFDRVAMTFHVHLIGSLFHSSLDSSSQVIYTNGSIEAQDAQNATITYPPYFNATAIFFHLVEARSVEALPFTYHSINGRAVPSVVYRPRPSHPDGHLAEIRDAMIADLSAMEQNFGPFLHPSLTGYIAGSGGMEYCGAFTASESAVNHELYHSYAARGIMPADGNAGWIDEALAVWWTSGMPSNKRMSGSSHMASHPIYTRTTDEDAYGYGMRFFAYLNWLLKDQGGLKPFLTDYYAHHAFTPYTTREFSAAMSAYYSTDLEPVFQKYVY